ncbi:MAG: hypothetical protein LBQ43_04030 [Holosporales bacterium]|jgi:hypothetical protein|nr:hypothetical protein [Holosporales bacterium]
MFNTNMFIKDVMQVHLSSNELQKFESIKGVRERLREFIDYDSALFTHALDEICRNTVGVTLFRLFLTKRAPGAPKIKIENIGPAQQEEYGEPFAEQEGSSYENNVVRINLNLYDSSGKGIPERQYYFVEKNGKIIRKGKSMPGSIFHEFVHALHEIEDKAQYKKNGDDEFCDYWTDKEELRTISGYMDRNIYDPICDNCFYLCNSITKGIQFHPRISHMGFALGKTNETDKSKELEQLYKTLGFNLAWPRKYMT